MSEVKYEKLDGSIINPINENFKMRKGDTPFNYIVIDDFLKPEVHLEIKNEFMDIPIDVNDLYKGHLMAPVDGPMLVGYARDWHDAYRMYITPKHNLRLNFFLQSDYNQFIESFWPDIPFTNEMLFDVHHHEKFSRDGFVHNDFDPSTFNQQYYKGTDISYSYAGGDACDNPDPNIRYVQKSMACVYYFGLGSKINEDEPVGGHTAFFTDDDRVIPYGGIEPLENRILMFEIGPKSFHASRTNNTLYRDALFGWHHSEMSYMKEKYPDDDLCLNVREPGAFQPSHDRSYGNAVE